MEADNKKKQKSIKLIKKCEGSVGGEGEGKRREV